MSTPSTSPPKAPPPAPPPMPSLSRSISMSGSPSGSATPSTRYGSFPPSVRVDDLSERLRGTLGPRAKRLWERGRERPLRSTVSETGLRAKGGDVEDLVYDSEADGVTSDDDRELQGRPLRRERSSGYVQGREEDKQWGVVKMEIMARSWGRNGLLTIYAGVYLISALTSLEANTTTLSIEPYFLSLLGNHSLLGTVAIVTNIAYAVGKPPMTKILDVFGRAEGIALAAAIYSFGFLLTASAQSPLGFIIARGVSALGGQGLQLAQQIIVADTTTLTNRGLITSTITLPWLVTTWLGPPLGAWFDSHGERGYRSAYATFGILLPVVAAVLVGTLLLEWRKVKLGNIRTMVAKADLGPIESELLREEVAKRRVWSNKRGTTWKELDIVGLLALTTGCGLVLLPLTLAARRPDRWADLGIWTMILGGLSSLAFFGWYETKISPIPLLPPRLLRNPTILWGSVLGFSHFASQFCYESFFTSFLQVAREHSVRDASYISLAYIFSASIAAIVAGLGAKFTQRYKWIGITGVIVHMLGTYLMMRTRNLDSPTWELILSQVVGGIGGGFTTIAAQIGCQAVVGHQDVAIATAVFLTITQIGGAVGGAIAGAVWSTLLPMRLHLHLPASDDDMIPKIMASLPYVLSFEPGTPIRLAINQSYVDTQRVLNGIAIFMLVPALLAVFMMKNVHLEREDQGQGEGVVVLGRASFIMDRDAASDASETSSLLDHP